jgi:hypothetical protein
MNGPNKQTNFIYKIRLHPREVSVPAMAGIESPTGVKKSRV